MDIHRSTDWEKPLDTHYSFLNKIFQAYVEDDNDIIIDYNIVKDICFNCGISVTTAVLVGSADLFGNRT